MAELVGQSLGQYEIIEEIAKGGMATVYLARQPSMGRNVAIKVLPSNFTHDDTFIERFNQEVEVIAQLQHPHILPVYDYGEFEDQPYIVMAYLSGGTLADVMAKKPLSVKEISQITGQVAEALDFAHSKGIIHRDLKPGNVLLDERNNAYLADFGLAKLAESAKDITGTNIIGTPTYMAPELTQSGEITPGVDIYALGITVYQMLTGDVPYNAPTLAGIMLAHITKPIPNIRETRPDLPDEVQHVISHSLAKQLTDRYPSSGEMARDLLAALEGRLGDELGGFQNRALLMTNMLGHVIFVDNQCLNLLKRNHNEARHIIGKPIHIALGCSEEVSKQLIESIRTEGEITDWEFDITDSRGNTRTVSCSALATRDDDGTFVGADITLVSGPKPQDQPVSEDFDTIIQSVDTQEKGFLQSYFVTQMESLYELMTNWAGKKVARYLEDIINETAERNVWAVHMENGRITAELKRTDLEVYQALLTRAMVYAASIIGKNQVLKEMEYVDMNTDPSILHFLQAMGLDQQYDSLLD